MRANDHRGALSEETVSVLFADSRRCELLRCLEAESSVEIDELARRVAAREADSPPDDVPEDCYRRTLISLYHRHLPKLESVDAVELDRTDGVSITARADVFERLAL